MTLIDEIVYKDVVVWNEMLTAAVENHCYVDSVKLFVQMIKGNEFDSATLVIVVSSDEPVKSLLHFKEMSYTGVLADNSK
ncbi:hypothetical protein AgCh_033572 [Apium graveolens]